ncbi:MAG: MG2 domain-containing protein, partial [Pseudomonadota bacterium]
MRRILLGLLVLLAGHVAAPVVAQNAIPEARYAITRNVDLPGGDIRSLFDTTLEACVTACITDQSCAAFTFNSRSNACFPKTVANEPEAYEGAISARVFRTQAGVLELGQARAAELGFLRDADLTRARDFAASLGRRHAANENSFATLLTAAQTRAGDGDALNAMRFTGAALTLVDRADLWLDYARYASDARVESNQRQAYRNRAVLAATNAYLRSESDGARVTALEDLARYLEAARRGRDAIPALRLAQSILPRDDVARALDAVIAKYGFRVVDTQVESDSAAPRICGIFSERLAKGVDYTPFVALPDARLAVTAEGDQICVSGVTHGARYTLTFREGLPAASGEALHKSVQQTLYVRDRTPAVRFPGRAFVLPKTELAAIPVVTVNTRDIELSLKRLSDRNLLRVRQEGLFGRPLSSWDLERFNADIAVEVWNGTGSVGQELNRDVTTRMPMAEALRDQPPGIYALQAAIPGADRFQQSPATQWFIVTDFGLRSLSGADGLTVEARSLADTSALGGATVTLISRSNTVLAETETNSDGVARFAPGLVNGLGGKAAALVTVRSDDDFAFLSLEDAAFDLSDRGVEGRAPAGAVDVFLTTDRGAYRAGETVHATVLARNGQAEAMDDLPITAHLKRPDGVTYQSRVSNNALAGGHVLSFPLAETVPRGTWEVAVYADPKAPPLQSTQILVEDFVPERIDFDLDLPDRLMAGQNAPLTVIGRYLFGAPAADLPVEGEIVLRAATEVDGYAGYRFGRHDDPMRPQREPILRSAQTASDGTLTQMLGVPIVSGEPRPMQAEVVVRMSEGSARPVERRITRPVAPTRDVIGIRPAFDGVVPEGTEARFDVLTLAPDLTPRSRSVTWTLNRVETRYQWYQLYGDWNWEPVTRRTRIATGTVVTGDG